MSDEEAAFLDELVRLAEHRLAVVENLVLVQAELIDANGKIIDHDRRRPPMSARGHKVATDTLKAIASHKPGLG